MSKSKSKDPIQKKLTEDIYRDFKKNKIDVLLDDRDERAGVKFKDADLIGIPFQIIIGRDSINEEVEYPQGAEQLHTKQSYHLITFSGYGYITFNGRGLCEMCKCGIKVCSSIDREVAFQSFKTGESQCVYK